MALSKEEEKSIINLKKYIEEDDFFNGKSKIESDFDKFCYEHCKDIHNVLALVEKQRAEEFEKLKKENEKLKEYIRIAPNLDEMTATKYRNIQQEAYIQGRAEEQQKAEQIIYENYISKQKIKDKIEKYQNMLKSLNKRADVDRIKAINERILAYKELLGGEEEDV